MLSSSLLDLSFVIGTPLYLHFLKSFSGSALRLFLFTLLLLLLLLLLLFLLLLLLLLLLPLDFLAHKGQWLLARPLCHELPNGKGQLLHIDVAQNTMHASNGFANLLFARFQMRPRFLYSYKFFQPSPNFGPTLAQLMFTFSMPKMHILSCSPQTGKDIADISRVS